MESFTVLVPAYNEEKIIDASTAKLEHYLLSKNFDNYQVLIVENGSTDGTFKKLKELKKKYKNIDYLSLPCPNLGEALIAGINRARYNRVVFIPMDLSMDMDFIDTSLDLLDRCDLVIGSRRVKGAGASRSILREFVGGSFQRLVRLVMKTNIRDTTYVKAFRKDAIEPLIPKVKLRYLFDTEICIRAEKEGLKVMEIPAKQVDNRAPREGMVQKIFRKSSNLYALRLFLWFERPLATLGTLGSFLILVGFVLGLYVIYMKIGGVKSAEMLGTLMLSVLLTISGLLVLILAFLMETLLALSSKIDELQR